ncbi:MAG: M67 family metallopeptidase [Rhodospirillaceae bacterium]|jgi:proteasome lid subunit RPN8/RPN11|nr:M67 family metallopeptidase [Rhodospirillaceae bacterium]MBT4116261.1 M67 family metallopeptidase [Rhodospirillaceae bacterium]MBT4673925.1 M67 family metallopeptidase [Rhodospirillaceae bacterium]MBT4719967.1 M67 family metallopeptidase [Rhodospirillaceae bacterium]MBT4748489.1 M67 family metallopeptidase [Rhodospirillaceae bacterium]
MKLTASHRRLIMDEAAAAYPAECCGLLVGTGSNVEGWTVTRVVPAANVAPPEPGHSIRDRFEVDPQTRFDLERELRGQPDAVIGHYHSHPDHPAEPSATDLAKAFEPSLIWIIASARAGEATGIAAFRLSNGAFEAIALEILDGE